MTNKQLTMSGWNYRIIRHAEHFSLHEVYYDDEGKPHLYSESGGGGIDLCVELHEGPDAIKGELMQILADIEKYPVIPVEDFSL